MKHPMRIVSALVGVVALAGVAACGSGNANPLGSANNATKGEVVVGSANFPENVLLAEIYAQALEAKGVKVKRQFNIGSREIIYGQIQSGGLTVLPEYNGALLAYLDKTTTATSESQVNSELQSKLPPQLEILNSSAAEDKDSVTVTRKTADQYHLVSIADLAPVAKNMVLGGPPEFKTRLQGIVGLHQVYGLTFKEFRPLDTAGPITVQALKRGDIQAANLFTTDPSIPANGFVVLQDPKDLFSAQNVTPLVYRKGVNPTVVAALNAVSAKLDTSTLAELDKKVMTDKDDPSTVAKDWLASAGLG